MTDRNVFFGAKARRAVAAALLAGTALTAGLTLPAAARDTAITAQPIQGLPGSFSPLVERVSPAVVTITAARTAPERMQTTEIPPQLEEFMRRFGLPPDALPGRPGRPGPGGPDGGFGRSLGSGFMIDAEGHIVTNRHVVNGADEVTVTLQDGTEMKADVVGEDDRTDLAVLKVEPTKPLPYLTFGDSDAVKPGDWVVAVGNPFGLGGTVTAGIVSARGREINAGPYDDFIQIDASINSGNSGGPTFNAAGEVVGINTAIYSPNGGSVGIGFAIPANLAKGVVDQLKTEGRVERGWLGVSLQGLTPELAESLSLTQPKGALISQVTEESPAAKGGLKAGDVVLKANGQPVDDTRDLARAVAAVKPGKEVELTVWRDGRERTLDVAVGSAPGQDQVASTRGGRAEEVEGLKLAELDGRWRERLSLDENAAGVVVTDVDGNATLRPGDVIETVNGEEVSKPADVRRALDKAKESGRTNALMLVRRGDATAFVPFKIG